MEPVSWIEMKMKRKVRVNFVSDKNEIMKRWTEFKRILKGNILNGNEIRKILK